MPAKGNQVALIGNTRFQETRTLLLEAISRSRKGGFCLGVKLVRGAYMEKERKLAVKEGRPDPVQDCWEDTNDKLRHLLPPLGSLFASNCIFSLVCAYLSFPSGACFFT